MNDRKDRAETRTSATPPHSSAVDPTPAGSRGQFAELSAARAQAELARAQADILRRAMLILARDPRMDELLDGLLGCLQEAVPCASARVLLTEGPEYLFVAREFPLPPNWHLMTGKVGDHAFLGRIFRGRENLFVSDTRKEDQWQDSTILGRAKSWIGIPLIYGNSVLGALSIGSPTAGVFGMEHFRTAKVLAIPFAIAVSVARIREWAVIYAEEREMLLAKAASAQTV